MYYNRAYQTARKTMQRIATGIVAITLTLGVSGGLPLAFAPRALAISPTITVCPGVCDYSDLQSAVNAANSGVTVRLDSDQTTTSEVVVSKPLTIDGNGHVLYLSFTKTNNSNNAGIGIESTHDVTLTNLTIDGSAGTDLHGVNVYESTAVSLSGVTITNNGHNGLVVNGSDVTVSNLTTADNAWGGIDVDQGSGVTTAATLTVNAASYQEEAIAIKIDDTTRGAHVTDADNQYMYADYGTTRIYTQIPTGLANLSPADGSYATTASLTTITWQAATSPHGPLTYYYESSHSNAVNGSGAFTSPVYQSGALSATHISTGGTPEGVYYWHVRAKDSLGNYGAWTTPWKVTVDNTAPSIPTITAPSNGQYFNSTPITDSWTASTDSLSGVDHYQIAYLYDDGHTFGGSTCPGVQINSLSLSGCRDTTSTSRNHVPGLTEQGGVTIWVRAFDKSGNASAWSTSVHYYYDATVLTAPTLLLPANNAVVNGASLTNSWSSVSGATTYEYESFNSSDTSSTPRYDHVYSTTSKTAANVADGTVFYWRVRAIDQYGQLGPWSSLWKVTVDNTAPVVAITNPNNNDAVSGTVNITGTITDNNPDHYYLVVLDQNNQVVAGPDVVNSPVTSFSYAWDTSTLADGTYTIDLEARDAAGNKDSQSTQQIQVTVDNDAPGIDDTFTVSMLTGKKITLDPQVTDTTGVTYQWSVSDNKLLNNPSDTLDGTSLTIGPAPKGNYTVTLTVTDAAGNTTTDQYTVSISTPAPSSPFVNHFNSPQVLGASTSNTGNTSSTDDNAPNTPAGTPNDGQVKGDSTTQPSGANLPATLSMANTSNFFSKVGWWWLAVLAAITVLFLLVALRRSGTNSTQK